MKDNKKKIFAAAAFLIAAGLVFGMSKKESGELLPESAANRTAVEAVDRRESEDGNAAKSGTGKRAASDDNSEDSRTARAGEISDAEESSGDDKSFSAAAVDNPEKSVIFVYICGEVVNPGVYELSEESRIYEAVDAAGGFTENAAKESINLASKVTDGMQITIYNREEAATLPANHSGDVAEAGRSGAEKSGLVNLNTATKEELMTLKGIGEAKAEDIIRYREKSGGFKKIEDIMKISGIKDAAFQKIKDDVTV